mgnify:CR=1 FL=1
MRGVVERQMLYILLLHLFYATVYRNARVVLVANLFRTSGAFVQIPCSHPSIAKWRPVSKLPFEDVVQMSTIQSHLLVLPSQKHSIHATSLCFEGS